MVEGGELFQSRLARGFELVLSRRPTAAEEGLLEDELQEHLREYREHPENARTFVTHGDSPNPMLNVVEHAAYTQVALLLLNLDETVTKP